jgi:Tlde1 domain
VLGVQPHDECRDGGLLIRLGLGMTAAGLAVFTIGFISAFWSPLDTGPANVELRAEARRLSVSDSIHPKRVDLDTSTIGSDGQDSSRARLAGLRTQDDFEFAFKELDNRSAPPPARSPFGEPFSFDESNTPNWFLQLSDLSASSDARFGGEASAPGTSVRSAAAAPRAAGPRVAAAAPAPRPAARSAVAQAEPKPAAPKPAPATGFRLASASDTSLPLGYAPSDPVKSSLITGSTPKDPTSKDSDPLAGIDPSHTAIYDITSRTVYLPNGRRLEAHSGLGDHMDDIRYVNRRGTGPTPPNVYELKLREELFHGVRAIRLIPTDSAKMYGRDGILAHSYLLGPNGQSNGCVSFSDYTAFLDAFLRGDINRIVVVERLADPPPPQAVSDWFSDKLKDFFRRS